MVRLSLRKKKKVLQDSNVARKLVTFTETKSHIIEQFRTIRTNIKFSMPDEQLKTILITSSTPGEGKSTNAANLGVVFAQEDKKVLIIDADMRKPTLHHTFKTFNKVGLSNILARRSVLHEAIQETFIVGLDVITSGPIPPNPAELLSSQGLEALFLEVKNQYDIIIIDSPPLLSVTDAQILANKCDGAIMVLNTGVTDKRAAKKAQMLLSASHTKILGVVLNNFKTPNHYNYYEGYRYAE
ncbi:capsular exopolysaccharide synthesis family protein [Solibacillus kalamii]|uniref:non-specific protein-tyrosine kinase n=1 Tax=Solibacillus kalamii TaxID=1748298 RepID=A0ABX3ZLR5_9BACL|nr:CpsD/CapB family tyrosine-protein kinase [Solibacillus kalamii]MBM7665275.1 capsular exopolysaccharide synthesis family protein [Solibacillus kalamii]OUZ40366.1 capsular biosynthesis protein [Solibacillus kalamii]